MELSYKMPQTTTVIQDVFKFLTELLPYATIFGLCFTAFKYTFVYFSEARKEAIREIVNDTVSSDIKELRNSIYTLSKAVGALESKIDKV